MQATWTENDLFLFQHLIQEDADLENALEQSHKNQFPEHEVSKTQGMLLSILIRMSKSKRVLELGTLAGYSTIWMAKAIPDDGVVVSLESEQEKYELASKNILCTGLQDRVDLICGPAAQSLQKLIDAEVEPFDFIFIDADKPNNPLYLRLCLQLSHSGTVIFGDNVIREGELCNAENKDPKVMGVRQYIQDLGSCEHLDSTAIQTVGIKGYDGFTLTFVK